MAYTNTGPKGASKGTKGPKGTTKRTRSTGYKKHVGVPRQTGHMKDMSGAFPLNGSLLQSLGQGAMNISAGPFDKTPSSPYPDRGMPFAHSGFTGTGMPLDQMGQIGMGQPGLMDPGMVGAFDYIPDFQSPPVGAFDPIPQSHQWWSNPAQAMPPVGPAGVPLPFNQPPPPPPNWSGAWYGYGY